MSTTYVKTTWNTGDVLTASRMSNLETQYDDVFSGGTFTGFTRLVSYDLLSSAISISANVLTVDVAASNVKTFSFNANITTTTISNPPPSGKYCQILFLVTANGSPFTWAWLTSTVVWDGGNAPPFVTTNGHVMAFTVYTVDGGTTWRGAVIALDYAS